MSWNEKDRVKFLICNKIITRGVKGSSSYRYITEYANKGLKVNCGEYLPGDAVGVSINGKRNGRLSFDASEVLLALDAGSVIVKDNTFHSSRHFNIGERELTEFLLANGYKLHKEDLKRAVWTKIGA